MRKPVIISVIVFISLLGGVIIICNTHPILMGLATGKARSLGKPIAASVYTDGRLDTGILIYRDPDSGYLLSLKTFDKYGMLRYIQIDTKYKLVGRPVGSGISDYDVISGQLIQSAVGQHFVDFQNDMKGFNMDPHLTVNGKEITFEVPYKYLKYHMIRVSFNFTE